MCNFGNVVQAVTARPDLCDVIGSFAVTTLASAAVAAADTAADAAADTAADATAADSQLASVPWFIYRTFPCLYAVVVSGRHVGVSRLTYVCMH